MLDNFDDNIYTRFCKSIGLQNRTKYGTNEFDCQRAFDISIWCAPWCHRFSNSRNINKWDTVSSYCFYPYYIRYVQRLLTKILQFSFNFIRFKIRRDSINLSTYFYIFRNEFFIHNCDDGSDSLSFGGTMRKKMAHRNRQEIFYITTSSAGFPPCSFYPMHTVHNILNTRPDWLTYSIYSLFWF